VLEERVNSLGVSEPSIYPQGNDRIVIELAGVDDPEAVLISSRIRPNWNSGMRPARCWSLAKTSRTPRLS
jgi:preprotein translocase subunit SecD